MKHPNKPMDALMSEALATHVENDPLFLAARAECAAIDARRRELQAEATRLQGLLRTVKQGTTIQEDPIGAFERVMQREELATLAVQKADVTSRYAEVQRDLRALEQFRHKADNRVGHVRRRLAARRVHSDDFVAALRAISAAADRLEEANREMRRLVSDVISREGHSDLVDAEFGALIVSAQDVGVWRAAAERLCGATLDPASAPGAFNG